MAATFTFRDVRELGWWFRQQGTDRQNRAGAGRTIRQKKFDEGAAYVYHDLARMCDDNSLQIENANAPPRTVEISGEEWTAAEFIDYLQTRLIPDLKESGHELTAKDFEYCVQFMKGDDTDVAERTNRK
jgi:hypothetical protein